LVSVLGALVFLALISPAYRGLSSRERTTSMLAAPGGVAVNTLTGNLVLQRRIFFVPDRGVPLDLYLTWNSDRRLVSSPFGMGWNLSYNARYAKDAAGNVTIVWGDGRVDRFTKSGGGFTAPVGVWSTLTEPAPGELRVQEKRGMVFRFASGSHRRLTSISDPAGNQLTLAYDAAPRLTMITLPSGRAYALSYDAQGRLATVNDANLSPSRTWTFAYDTADRLTAITDPLGRAEAFAYDASNLITTITDRRGNAATIAYTSPAAPPPAFSGADVGPTPTPGTGTWLTESVEKGGSEHSYEFNVGSSTTIHIDPNGNPWGTEYDLSNRAIELTTPVSETTQQLWDADNNLTALTDARGTVIIATFDANGNMTDISIPVDGNPANNIRKSWVYAATPTCTMLQSFTSPNGDIWTIVGDDECNVVEIEDPAGSSATWTFDGSGQPTSYADRTNRIWDLQWSLRGEYTGKTDPAGAPTTYEYDGASRRIGATDPLGNTFQRAFNAVDDLVTLTDGLGNSALFEYDPNRNLTQATDREGNPTRYEYDPLDQVIRIVGPISDTVELGRDDAGNIITFTDQLGSNWLQAFDENGLVVSRTNPLDDTWLYGWDENRNLVTHTDALGRPTIHVYDLANRLTQRAHDDTTVVNFGYDGDSNIVTTTDKISGTSSFYANYEYTWSYLGGMTLFKDKLLNRTVARTFDDEGRIESETGPKGDASSYGYDLVGRLSEITAFGGTTSIQHDDAGNVTFEIRPNGVSSEATYDANNNLDSLVIRGPGGSPVLRSAILSRNDNDHIVAVVRETGETVDLKRNPLGLVTEESGDIAPTGIYTYTLAYNAAGQPTQSVFIDSSTIVSNTTTYDDAGLGSQYVYQPSTGPPTIINYVRDANGAQTAMAFTSPSTGTIPFFNDARNRTFQIGSGGSAYQISRDPFDFVTFANPPGSDSFRLMHDGGGNTAYVFGSKSGATFDTVLQRLPGDAEAPSLLNSIRWSRLARNSRPLDRAAHTWLDAPGKRPLLAAKNLTGPPYQIHHGGNLADVVGAQPPDNLGQGVHDLPPFLVTNNSGSVVGSQDWAFTGDDRSPSTVQPFLAPFFHPWGNGVVDLGNGFVNRGGGNLFDVFSFVETTPGGAAGASWPTHRDGGRTRTGDLSAILVEPRGGGCRTGLSDVEYFLVNVPSGGASYESNLLGGIELEVARSVSLGVRYVHRTIPQIAEGFGVFPAPDLREIPTARDPWAFPQTTSVVLADGSPRYLGSAISPETWRALGGTACGDSPLSDW